MASTPLIDKCSSKKLTKQGGAVAEAAAEDRAGARELSNDELLRSRCRQQSNTSSELDLNVDNSSSSWIRDFNPTTSFNDPSPQNTSMAGEMYSDLSLPVTPQDPAKCTGVHFNEKKSSTFANSTTTEKRGSPERSDIKPNAFLETIQNIMAFINLEVYRNVPELFSGTQNFQADSVLKLFSFRTHSHLKRTRLIYVFYVVALPIYTVTGALIFQSTLESASNADVVQLDSGTNSSVVVSKLSVIDENLFKALDGEHDDKLCQEYEDRCKLNRQKAMDSLRMFCNTTPANCYLEVEKLINDIDVCYKVWHDSHRMVTHSMSDFTNAVVYAFSIYTTIGYGNMAADTIGCRIATIIYGVFGIPLFFASVKEAGNMFRNGFISLYKYIRKLRRRKRLLSNDRNHSVPNSKSTEQILNHTVAIFVERAQELVVHKNEFERKFSMGSLPGVKNGYITFTEQRRSFTNLVDCTTKSIIEGFGDVFPKEPWIVLLHSPLIVMGVVLFSMCYFILQEEIREKAFEASRKARMSISKYSHTLMTRNPWSRRNSPAFDSAGQSPEPSAFERQRKRRQSAPNVLTVPTLNLPGCNF
uniref:Ion_trans_2 domain-containing protein n=1 Tax=Syphacia muris TaxID=451379 RepID=A0A0N5AV14_9BILA